MQNYTTADFDYYLPEELIAKEPLSKRDQSRLLVVQNTNDLIDSQFEKLIDYLDKDDLIIFNDSRVIKARLFGQKISGGKIELLIERVISNNEIIAHVRSNKTINIGLEICLSNELNIAVIEKLDGLFRLQVKSFPHNDFMWFDYLDKFGHIPLPPYMKRNAVLTDDKTYQTVYAKTPGSVAAPTAGLHFTEKLLAKINSCGVKIAHVTLHVGSGTFKPVSVMNLADHKMHSEVYNIHPETIDLIKKTKKNGNKVVAVGTTSLRVLESVAKTDFKVLCGETDIFITPGFEFKVVDKLVTNFHLPQSTLLMLVSAFAGFDKIKQVYTHAIKQKYRFYSYGDAMLLDRKT